MVTVLLSLVEDAQKRVDTLGRRLDSMEITRSQSRMEFL